MIQNSFEIIFLLSQIPYFARMYFQTKYSLKEKNSVNPKIFWELTIVGAILMIIYGILIGGWAIALTQTVGIFYSLFHRSLSK